MANCDLLQANYIGQVDFIMSVIGLLPVDPKAFPLSEIRKMKSYRNVKDEVVSYFPMIRAMILDNDGAEMGNIADSKQDVVDALNAPGASVHSGPVKDALKRLRDRIMSIFPDINASYAVEARVGALLDPPAGMSKSAVIAAMNHMCREYVTNVESYFATLLRNLKAAYQAVKDHCPDFLIRSRADSSSGARSSSPSRRRRRLRAGGHAQRRTVRRY
jgi:hypothetical protein